MPRLFLRFSTTVHRDEEGIQASVDWLVRDDSGDVEGRASLASLADVVETHAPWADNPDNVVVFVPAAEVLAVTCSVPGRNAAQVRRAIPYAVEEFVAQDIDTMHVAPGDVVRNEPVGCLVVSRQAVEDWLEAVSSAGAAAGVITVDAMALAECDDSVSVLFDGNVALLRGADQIAGVDVPNLAAALASLRSETDEPQTLRLVNGTMSAAELALTDVDFGSVDEARTEGTVLHFLANEFAPEHAINLLQGEYAVRRRPRGTWSHWRPVAIAAALWLGVGLVVLAAQGFWANHQAGELRRQAEELYREIYKVERIGGNPANRMRRQLGQTTTTSPGFHQLVGQLGVGLGDVAGRHELRRLQFSARRGLDAELVVNDGAVLDALGARLGERGLGMEILSTDSSQAGGQIGARVRLVSEG